MELAPGTQVIILDVAVEGYNTSAFAGETGTVLKADHPQNGFVTPCAYVRMDEDGMEIYIPLQAIAIPAPPLSALEWPPRVVQ